ncbi:hypothetical protein LXA10_17955, partial [Erwinia amylovora]|nr:hypothetical protein [Erwinia amylovora]
AHPYSPPAERDAAPPPSTPAQSLTPLLRSALTPQTSSATPGRRPRFTPPVPSLFAFRTLAGADKKDATRQRYDSCIYLSGLFMLRLLRSRFV